MVSEFHKMKILVTGSNGLLGQKLVLALKERADMQVMACGRGENRIGDSSGYEYFPLDLTDETAVKELVRQYTPDCIIHTAAMTNVDACELDPEACRKANVEAVTYLLDACKGTDVHFIHISTDFVFNGESGPYRETDPIGPLSVYAASKAEAEDKVMNSGLRWAILRTMIIYGVTDDAQRSNIVLWTKRSLEKGQNIRVISDQYRGPTLAEDLAQACISTALRKAEGLFHVSGREVISILDIAIQVADFFGLDKRYIHPVTTAELKQPALRPLRTGFIIDKAMRELDFHPHSLEEGLAIVKAQLERRQATQA